MVNWDSFDKIWASTSPLTPYEFSDPNYSQGWNFVGSTPPARQMWDSIQKTNDEKFKYLRDNFGTPNIVTQASQMTDTDKVYVYLGSEAGWNNGHWYYYDEGTSSWADGGVYNSVAFVTDTTLSVAGQPADAKATGDALALKSDLAGCTFTGNVGINADLSVTGDATIGTDLSVAGDSTLTGNVSASGDVTVVGDVSSANLTTSADATIGGDLSVTGASTLTGNITTSGDISADNISANTNATVGGNLSVTGTSTLTGDINAGADIVAVGDISADNLTTTTNATVGGSLSVAGTSTLTGNVNASGNISAVGDITSANISTTNATIGGNATVTGDVSCANLTTSADATVGGDLTVTGDSTLADATVNDLVVNNDLSVAGDSTLADATVNDLVVNNDLSVAGDSSLTNLSVSGTTALAGTSTAPTPSADDNSTKIATTQYVQTEIKPIEVNADIVNKRVSNIEKLLQGNLYDYQTDSDSAYTKTVLAGAMPYASLNEVGGKTVVWNQLVDSGTTTVATISGHKYYTLIDGTASIVTADGTAISVVDDTADMVCDLTLMMGSGNEFANTSDFTAVFPATHYPYNAGTLLSAGVTEVVSAGANLLPSFTTSGSSGSLTWTVDADGTVTVNGSTSSTVTIDAPQSTWKWDGTTPCWLSGCPAGGNANNGYSLRVDSNLNNWSNYDVGNGVALAPYSPNHILYGVSLYFRIVIRSGTVCNNLTFKPMLNYGTSAGKYYPYRDSISYPIPADIQSLEGYGWSAGSVFNYVDFERKVFVKCVDKIVLDGTQNPTLTNWQPLTNSVGWGYSNGLISVKKSTNDYVPSNIVTNRIPSLPYIGTSGIYGQDIDGICSNIYAPSYSFLVRITDTTLTNATSINNYLSANPLTVYYELATPVEVDISAYLTDDNLISVESGGTLTFPNSNGDDYRIDVPSQETYMVDLQSAL